MKTLRESIFSSPSTLVSMSRKTWIENNIKGDYKLIETKTGKLKLRGRCIIKDITDKNIPNLEITEMNGTLIITKCHNLENINNLFDKYPKGKFNITISNNDKLLSINGLPVLYDGNLEISYNPSLTQVTLPEMVNELTFVKNKIKMNEKSITATTRVFGEINCATEDDSINMITEEFHSKLLSDLAKQFKQDHEYNKNTDEWDKNHNVYYKTRFKQIMDMSNNMKFKWTDIGPEDIYEFDHPDKECLSMCRKVIQYNMTGFIICKKNGRFTYIIQSSYVGQSGSSKRKVYVYSAGGSTYTYGWEKNYTMTSAIDLISEQDKIYIIVPIKKDRYELINSRQESQKGMILMDKESFERIAAENMDRYKNILAKRKAEGVNEYTELDKKVKSLLMEVMDINMKYHANPGTYDEYRLSELNEMVYGEEHYRAPTRLNKRTVVREDGLMTIYNKYSKNVVRLKSKSSTDNDYSTYYTWYKRSSDNLKDFIKRIDKKIASMK